MVGLFEFFQVVLHSVYFLFDPDGSEGDLFLHFFEVEAAVFEVITEIFILHIILPVGFN
jgi:hypothetical protein